MNMAFQFLRHVKAKKLFNSLNQKQRNGEKKLTTEEGKKTTKDGSEKKRKAKSIDEDCQQERRIEEKEKKKTAQENQVGANASVSQNGNKGTSILKSEEKQTAGKSSQVRTFLNGLVVEDLEMGKPDGKRASRGKQVSVHYWEAQEEWKKNLFQYGKGPL